MKRIAALLSVVILASCSDGMLDPGNVTVPASPRLATFDGAGPMTFHASSGCAIDGGSYTCSYLIQNVPDGGPYDLWVDARYTFTYQCVHSKNGKAHKNGAVQTATLWSNDYHYESPAVVSGEMTGSGIVVPWGFGTPNMCGGNKGAFTTTQILSGPTPAGWSIYVERDGDESSNWAWLYDY